jgi:iron complex outermembrane receptor protein
MLYQTIKLLKGNKFTLGVDAKQFGGEGNNGMARDSLITINEIAFYGYMQQSFFHIISLSAGLRIENNSNYGNELVPMVGLNVNPTATSSLKASVSKGFRSPTIMETFLFAPNPDLKPERMINYELSWLQDYFNMRLHTEITLFTMKGDNIIQVAGQYPNVRRENIGTFLNKGIEIAIKFKATDNLFFHSNYSYLSTKEPIIAAPAHQFNLNINYSYKMLNLNVSAQHIEKLYTSVDPEITECYTLLNARLNVEIIKYLNVFILANNILNQEYEINYGYPMPKINFSAGIKFSL